MMAQDSSCCVLTRVMTRMHTSSMTTTDTLSLAPQSVSARIKRAGFAIVTGDRSRPGVHVTGGRGKKTFVNVIADENSSRIAAEIAELLTDAGYKVNAAGRSMTLDA